MLSVCSPTLEEGPGVARDLPGFRVVPFAGELGLSSDADGVLRLGPWLGTDAYRIVRFERVAAESKPALASASFRFGA